MFFITTEEYIPMKIGELAIECPYCQSSKKHGLFLVDTIARFGPLKLFKMFRKTMIKCKECGGHFRLDNKDNKKILNENKNIEVKQNVKEYCEFYGISERKRKTNLIVNYVGSFFITLLFSFFISIIGILVFDSENFSIFGILFVISYILIMLLQTYYFVVGWKVST